MKVVMAILLTFLFCLAFFLDLTANLRYRVKVMEVVIEAGNVVNHGQRKEIARLYKERNQA